MLRRQPHTSRAPRDGLCDYQSEHGQAVLVATIVLALVMGIIASTLFQTSSDNINIVGHNIQQEQALRAARSGIDVAYQQIQAQTHVATVPCGTATRPTPPAATTPTSTNTSMRIRGTLSGNVRSHYSVTIKYFSEYTNTSGAATTPLTCNKIKRHTVDNTTKVNPKAVVLSSTGVDPWTSTDPTKYRQTKYVTSLAHVAVAPISNSTFQDGIHTSNLDLNGASGITVNTRTTVYITATRPTTPTSTGTVKCSGKAGAITANIVVIGKITVGCQITGSVTATKTVTVGSAGSILTRGSHCPTGTTEIQSGKNIQVNGNGTVTENMLAAGSITKGRSTCVSQATATFVIPPSDPFPSLKWTAGSWQAAHYYTFTTMTTCTYLDNTVLAKLDTTSTPHFEGPVAISTHSCTVPKGFPGSIALKHKLAFFTTQTITLTGHNTKFRVTQNPTAFDVTTTIDLYLVQPWHTPPLSPLPGMYFGGSSGATSNLAVFLYTQGAVTVKGSPPFPDLQVYAQAGYTPSGTPSLTRLVTTPTSPGGSNSTPNGQPFVGIIYVRETTP